MRLTLDPVFATQRPFAFYAFTYCINLAAYMALRSNMGWGLGFRHLKEFDAPSSAQRIYYRPAPKTNSSIASGGRGGDGVYGAGGGGGGGGERMGSGKALPVVFVHGLGIGFAHYLALIAALPTEVDVFLVEWPYVTMQMVSWMSE